MPSLASKRSSYTTPSPDKEEPRGRAKLSRSKPPLTALNSHHPSRKTHSRSNSVDTIDSSRRSFSSLFRRSRPSTPTEDPVKSEEKERSFAKAFANLIGRRRQSVSQTDDPRSLAEAYLPTSPIYHNGPDREAEKERVVGIEERAERRRSGVSLHSTKTARTEKEEVPDMPEVPPPKNEKRVSAMMERPHAITADVAKPFPIAGVYDQPGRLLSSPTPKGSAKSRHSMPVPARKAESTSSLDDEGYFPAMTKKDTQSTQAGDWSVSNSGTEDEALEERKGKGRKRGNSPPPVAFLNRYRPEDFDDGSARGRPALVSRSSKFSEALEAGKETPTTEEDMLYHAVTTDSIHRGSTDDVTAAASVVQSHQPRTSTASQNSADGATPVVMARTSLGGGTRADNDGFVGGWRLKQALHAQEKSSKAAHAPPVLPQDLFDFELDKPATRTEDSIEATSEHLSELLKIPETVLQKDTQAKDPLYDRDMVAPPPKEPLVGSVTTTISADKEKERGVVRKKSKRLVKRRSQVPTPLTPPISSASSTTGHSGIDGFSSPDHGDEEEKIRAAIAKGKEKALRDIEASNAPKSGRKTWSLLSLGSYHSDRSDKGGIKLPSPKELKDEQDEMKQQQEVGLVSGSTVSVSSDASFVSAVQRPGSSTESSPSGGVRIPQVVTAPSTPMATPQASRPTTAGSTSATRIPRPKTPTAASRPTTAGSTSASSIPRPKTPTSSGTRPKTPTTPTRQKRPHSMQLPPGPIVITNKSPIKNLSAFTVPPPQQKELKREPSFPAPAGVPASSLRTSLPPPATQKTAAPPSPQPSKARPALPTSHSSPASTKANGFTPPPPSLKKQPSFPAPAGVPASSLGMQNGIPPVPPIPASQRGGYPSPRKGVGMKVVSPLRNEVRGSPELRSPQGQASEPPGMLTSHLKRTPSNGSGLTITNGNNGSGNAGGLQRKPSNGSGLSINGSGLRNGASNGAGQNRPNIQHRKSHSTSMATPVNESPKLPNGTVHRLNDPAMNYSFSSPHTNGLPYGAPSLPSPSSSHQHQHHHSHHQPHQSIPGAYPTTPLSPNAPNSPLGLPGVSVHPLRPNNGSSSSVNSTSGATKPLAKLFVICCSCNYWHDLPSAMYIDMASRGSVVQCPWCMHRMGTQCCQGWTCVVERRVRHH